MQSLEMPGKVGSHHESQNVGFQRIKIGIMKRLNRSFFYRSIHSFDLAVSPRMVRLGSPVFDVVLVANTIKIMSPKAVGGTASISRLFGKCCTVVSQDGLYLVWKRFDSLTLKHCPVAFCGRIE